MSNLCKEKHKYNEVFLGDDPCKYGVTINVSETASIIRSIILLITLMMEASSTSEKSVNFYQTTRHNT
jgi:hypothetical protein